MSKRISSKTALSSILNGGRNFQLFLGLCPLRSFSLEVDPSHFSPFQPTITFRSLHKVRELLMVVLSWAETLGPSSTESRFFERTIKIGLYALALEACINIM